MATRSPAQDGNYDPLDRSGPALLLGCMIGLALFVLFALSLAVVVSLNTFW